MQTQSWSKVSARRHRTTRHGYRLTVIKLPTFGCFEWFVSKGGRRVKAGLTKSLKGGQTASVRLANKLADA